LHQSGIRIMTSSSPIIDKYPWLSAEPEHTSSYLWEPIIAECSQFGAKRVLDLGCGNGAFCGALVTAGFQTVGCDPSSDGISIARNAVPNAAFRQMGVDDDPAELGRDFDVVVSTEVVEHLILPRGFRGLPCRFSVREAISF
jgi:2-polyprenyl-3-methyl-5-hydroxy-6-metoxy-1,4-benzoquinol methylase